LTGKNKPLTAHNGVTYIIFIAVTVWQWYDERVMALMCGIICVIFVGDAVDSVPPHISVAQTLK